jgi:DinB superfamily
MTECARLFSAMPLPACLLTSLASAPRQIEDAFSAFPKERWTWKPEDWGGSPGEPFAPVEHACHLRDIEKDGYHVRIRRLRDEARPDLVSLDGFALATERAYLSADPFAALAAFAEAREETLRMIRALDGSELARAGSFGEYGEVTLGGLLHYLQSHDQQHLACLAWLAGKLASESGAA